MMDMSMPSTGSNATMMPMSSMAMTFFTSQQTPLFSSSWMPSNTGDYAGTCIFLIILGAILQFLLSSRALYYRKLVNLDMTRREIKIQDSTIRSMASKLSETPFNSPLTPFRSKITTLEMECRSTKSRLRHCHSWRWIPSVSCFFALDHDTLISQQYGSSHDYECGIFHGGPCWNILG